MCETCIEFHVARYYSLGLIDSQVLIISCVCVIHFIWERMLHATFWLFLGLHIFIKKNYLQHLICLDDRQNFVLFHGTIDVFHVTFDLFYATFMDVQGSSWHDFSNKNRTWSTKCHSNSIFASKRHSNWIFAWKSLKLNFRFKTSLKLDFRRKSCSNPIFIWKVAKTLFLF